MFVVLNRQYITYGSKLEQYNVVYTLKSFNPSQAPVELFLCLFPGLLMQIRV